MIIHIGPYLFIKGQCNLCLLSCLILFIISAKAGFPTAPLSPEHFKRAALLIKSPRLSINHDKLGEFITGKGDCVGVSVQILQKCPFPVVKSHHRKIVLRSAQVIRHRNLDANRVICLRQPDTLFACFLVNLYIRHFCNSDGIWLIKPAHHLSFFFFCQRAFFQHNRCMDSAINLIITEDCRGSLPHCGRQYPCTALSLHSHILIKILFPRNLNLDIRDFYIALVIRHLPDLNIHMVIIRSACADNCLRIRIAIGFPHSADGKGNGSRSAFIKSYCYLHRVPYLIIRMPPADLCPIGSPGFGQHCNRFIFQRPVVFHDPNSFDGHIPILSADLQAFNLMRDQIIGQKALYIPIGKKRLAIYDISRCHLLLFCPVFTPLVNDCKLQIGNIFLIRLILHHQVSAFTYLVNNILLMIQRIISCRPSPWPQINVLRISFSFLIDVINIGVCIGRTVFPLLVWPYPLFLSRIRYLLITDPDIHDLSIVVSLKLNGIHLHIPTQMKHTAKCIHPHTEKLFPVGFLIGSLIAFTVSPLPVHRSSPA